MTPTLRSSSALLRNNKVARALGIIFFSLLATYFSSNTAHAAPTTVTGTISNIPANAYVWVTGEKKVGDNWVNIPGARVHDVQITGSYSLNLGEVTGSQIRVWAFVDSGNGYLLGGDVITVSSTSITKNFTVGSINVKLQASTPDHCINGSAGVRFSTPSSGPNSDEILWANLNSSGLANFLLPAGNEIVFIVHCLLFVIC
jgi:hypothetical protein